jgi:hypothetical protein
MLEILMLGLGVYGLATGKFWISKKQQLKGWRGRVCGGIFLLHLPVSMVAGLVLGLTGGGMTEEAAGNVAFGVGLASMLTLFTIAVIVAKVLYRGQAAEEGEIVSAEVAVDSNPATQMSAFTAVQTPATTNEAPHDPIYQQIARAFILLGGLFGTMVLGFVAMAALGEIIAIPVVIASILLTAVIYRAFLPRKPKAIPTMASNELGL